MDKTTKPIKKRKIKNVKKGRKRKRGGELGFQELSKRM
jgi:hypothetical protein